MIEGQQGADHRVQTSHVVGQREGGADGGAILIALHIGHAGERLQGGAQTGQMAVGAGLAIAGHMGDDDVGVDLSHFLNADAPLVQGTGLEVLKDHVALGHQLEKQLLALLVVEIQGDALLVSPHRGPADADAVLQGAHSAEGIAPAGHLDFDHFGAKVGQDAGAPGTGDHGGNIQDLNALQSSSCHIHILLNKSLTMVLFYQYVRIFRCRRNGRRSDFVIARISFILKFIFSLLNKLLSEYFSGTITR